MPSPSHFTDFQPYLLPGTDPWALPEDKAVALLDYLKSRRINRIYCIPPVKQENKNNSPDFLLNAFLAFREKHSDGREFKLAARYRLDDGFAPLLKRDDFLTIGKELVIDVSPLEEYERQWRMIKAIGDSGYTPVLIQPERIGYWKTADFARLKELGCKLILNLYSLFGYNGDNALMYSREILSRGMYDYLFSGIEDVKVMRYSENFTLDEDDGLLRELSRLEDNGRLLWADHTGG